MITLAALVRSLPELPAAELESWIDRRWVRPEEEGEAVLFEDIDVARVRLIWVLRRELRMSEDAVPVVLSLIDQLHAALVRPGAEPPA